MSSINTIGQAGSSYLYGALSSGKRINTAADGAAEMAISQEFDRQNGGFEVGTRNLKDAKNAANIADGALDGITGSLQRMRELAVQASNGLLSDDDRSYIQAEIDQLKKGIGDIADKANFNGIPLLDNEDGKVLLISSDANGTQRPLSRVDGSLEALGIKDFDVTKDGFDIGAIDKALKTLNGGRSQVGAQSNSFDVAIGINGVSDYNTYASKSSMMDTEYGSYVSKLKNQNILEQTRAEMMRKKREDAARQTMGIIGN
ncbi:MAG: flagellin FliC5 [Lachnospiraceae bacterium]|nr:flagellin FliC5 [Lachnospiraceae bacterium]